MRVLNLVTNHRATFYRNQITSLERIGVDCTTLAVPGRAVRGGDSNSRTPLDYARFYPKVLRHSLSDFDVVHANYGLTAPFALAQPLRPVVLSLWGSDVFGTYRPLSQWCAKRCDAVVVMSEEMANELDPPCEVIPHGVDMDQFAPQPQDEARAAVGWHEDAMHVLFPYPASRPVKNYPRARRVVDRARSRVDGRIELHTISGVPHERVATYMNAADSLLLTSIHEGSPNVVKEALACRLPIVTTDVGDVGERLEGVSPSFVRSDDDGLIDALVTVLERGERSNGREIVEALSVERMGERLLDLYESVEDRCPGGARNRATRRR